MNSSSTDKTNPSVFFRRQKLMLTLFFLLMIALAAGSSVITDFQFADLFRAIPRVARWMAKNLFPDAKAMSRLPNILDKLADTIFMAIMSTVASAVFALFFALLGSRTTRPNRFFSTFARIVASVNRNIPVVAWAMIFILAFGTSDFTGFLALFFVTFGFLTRAFMETIDETSSSSVEALTAAGASYLQIIAQAVIPASMPQILSWMLYMIETNIRSATLVGLLTGSGIGFLFDIYYKSLQYRSASLVILCIVVVVLAIELISNALRRVIL